MMPKILLVLVCLPVLYGLYRLILWAFGGKKVKYADKGDREVSSQMAKLTKRIERGQQLNKISASKLRRLAAEMKRKACEYELAADKLDEARDEAELLS